MMFTSVQLSLCLKVFQLPMSKLDLVYYSLQIVILTKFLKAASHVNILAYFSLIVYPEFHIVGLLTWSLEKIKGIPISICLRCFLLLSFHIRSAFYNFNQIKIL